MVCIVDDENNKTKILYRCKAWVTGTHVCAVDFRCICSSTDATHIWLHLAHIGYQLKKKSGNFAQHVNQPNQLISKKRIELVSPVSPKGKFGCCMLVSAE